MKAPLFDDILRICQSIADASSKEDEAAREKSYQELIKLCSSNDNSPRNHPLQWEALADFTNDAEQAIDIYTCGLTIAEKLELPDFIGSIHMSMGQRYQEMEDTAAAKASADKAAQMVETVTNEELKAEIVAFIASVS